MSTPVTQQAAPAMSTPVTQQTDPETDPGYYEAAELFDWMLVNYFRDNGISFPYEVPLPASDVRPGSAEMDDYYRAGVPEGPSEIGEPEEPGEIAEGDGTGDGTGEGDGEEEEKERPWWQNPWLIAGIGGVLTGDRRPSEEGPVQYAPLNIPEPMSFNGQPREQVMLPEAQFTMPQIGQFPLVQPAPVASLFGQGEQAQGIMGLPQYQPPPPQFADIGGPFQTLGAVPFQTEPRTPIIPLRFDEPEQPAGFEYDVDAINRAREEAQRAGVLPFDQQQFFADGGAVGGNGSGNGASGRAKSAARRLQLARRHGG